MTKSPTFSVKKSTYTISKNGNWKTWKWKYETKWNVQILYWFRILNWISQKWNKRIKPIESVLLNDKGISTYSIRFQSMHIPDWNQHSRKKHCITVIALSIWTLKALKHFIKTNAIQCFFIPNLSIFIWEFQTNDTEFSIVLVQKWIINIAIWVRYPITVTCFFMMKNTTFHWRHEPFQ